jgi:hypothetical protein
VTRLPDAVAEIRKQQCKAAGCAHELDYADACAECPAGHWGPLARDCGQHLPSLPVRAKNFAIASLQEASAIASGVPALTDEEINRRLAICFSIASPCSHLTANGECSLCGCPMRRKAPWRSQTCKAGKW